MFIIYFVGGLYCIYSLIRNSSIVDTTLKYCFGTYGQHVHNNNNNNNAELKDSIDIYPIYSVLDELYSALDHVYYEESKSAVQFLLLLIISSHEKLVQEQILFQKFLYQNRNRILSAGLSPPLGIFKSQSSSSIDVPLVAVWLTSLSKWELETFHNMRRIFNKLQKEKDDINDITDKRFLNDSNNLLNERKVREDEYLTAMSCDMKTRMDLRILNFTDYLNDTEKYRFALVMDDWFHRIDFNVEEEDSELYKKFLLAFKREHDQTATYARTVLQEIESVQRDCRYGEYGREYQFVDSSFEPNDTSIGQGKQV